MSARRRCKGKTRAGKVCKAAPLKDDSYCLAHSTRKHEVSPGFGGPQPGSGRPRNPNPREIMQRVLEQNAEEFVQTYLDAARNAVVVAKYEGEVNTSDVADYSARIGAIEKLLDRVEGKPRQLAEITGPDGKGVPIELGLPDLSQLSASDKRQLLALLRKTEAGDGSTTS